MRLRRRSWPSSYPLTSGGEASVWQLFDLLGAYAISFGILFSLWLQHRRINVHVERYGPGGLWLTAAILMLVCLIPRATILVFEHGGNVTVLELINAMPLAPSALREPDLSRLAANIPDG
jgi:uncharacterized membrane protein